MRIASFSDAGLTKACASALQPRSTAAARHMRCWTAAAPVAVTRHKAALAAMRRRVRGILEIKWVRPGRPGVVQLEAALAGAQFRTCLARARQRSKFSAVRRSRRERELASRARLVAYYKLLRMSAIALTRFSPAQRPRRLIENEAGDGGCRETRRAGFIPPGNASQALRKS